MPPARSASAPVLKVLFLSLGAVLYTVVNLYILSYFFDCVALSPSSLPRGGLETGLAAGLVVIFYILPSLIPRVAERAVSLNIRFILVSLALVFLLGWTDAAKFLTAPLIVSDSPRKADAIVVLGSKTESLAVLGIERAAELYRAGESPRILVINQSWSQTRKLANEFELPLNAILIEPEIEETRLQALVAHRIFEENKWRSAILVSPPIEMYRAGRTFERVGLEVRRAPVAVAVWYEAVRDSGVEAQSLGEFRLRHLLFERIRREYVEVLRYYLNGHI